MIEWVLDSIIALNLRHSEFLWQGTGIDGYREQRVGSIHQIVKVTGNASFEGVHHDLHLFLHRLHLRENRWRGCIHERSMLKFRRSGLLGSLLPSGLLGPPRLELSLWFSSWTLCPASL